jgi:DNA primase catalytic core
LSKTQGCLQLTRKGLDNGADERDGRTVRLGFLFMTKSKQQVAQTTAFLLPSLSLIGPFNGKLGVNLSTLSEPVSIPRSNSSMSANPDSSLRDVITQVKENADIVAVIGQYVPLKKAGSRYLGVCPFHHDRRPSMNVTPQMGIFKCFACGAGGDVIRFVQDYEKLSFLDALKAVASRAGIPIPEKFALSEGPGREKTELALAANQLAAQYYQEQIEKRSEVLDYVAARGISTETRKQFQLGFAPDALDGLLRRAESKRVPVEALMEAGIVGETEGGRRYERFGGRLIFPIWNLSGHVIGFGGRTLDPQGQPKYVNSPESPLYHKSRVLYGFNFSRSSIDKAQEVVLVEGYMDMLSLWQAGVRNAVAVSGTALTRDHVHILGRFARRAILFFDGDGPGRKAVQRSLEPLLAQGIEVRVPVLPGEHDPDSFTKAKGLDAVQALFGQSEDLVGFLLRQAGKSPEAMSPEEKDALLKEATSMMAPMPSEVVRQGHLETLRKALQLSAAAIRASVGQSAAGAAKPHLTHGPRPTLSAEGGLPGLFLPEAGLRPRDEAVPEWQLLQLVLAYPEEAAGKMADFELDAIQDPLARDLLDHVLALHAETGSVSWTELLERLPESLRDALLGLETLETTLDEEKKALKLRLLSDVLYNLELRALRRNMASETDLSRLLALQKRLKEITNRNKGGMS